MLDVCPNKERVMTKLVRKSHHQNLFINLSPHVRVSDDLTRGLNPLHHLEVVLRLCPVRLERVQGRYPRLTQLLAVVSTPHQPPAIQATTT